MSEPDEAQLWKKILKPQGGCPQREALHALLEDSPQALDSGIGRHVRQCLRCSAELDLMRKITASDAEPEEEEAVEWMAKRLKGCSHEIFQEEAPPAPQPAAKPRPRSARPFWDWLLTAPGLTALASAMLAVAILGGIWLSWGGSDPLVAPQGPPVVRSERIAQMAPSGNLTQPPQRFSWRAVAGAATYRVQVFEVDQSEIWSGESTDSELLLPRPLREGIVPGKRLLWQVTAFDEQGRRLASSTQAGFRVERER